MILAIVLFFGASLVLYAVFGGADFGAGMIEGLISKKHREEEEELISHAMAPVWEANHVWLVLAIVILFSAFPKVFSEISTVFHLPLLIMLFGIILRGCAFTFRHYDPYYDRSQRTYSRFFIASSFITPMAQGLIIGGCLLGDIPKEQASFLELYVSPWMNMFSVSVALFLCTMYIFVAAVFLIAESENPELRSRYLRRTKEAIAGLILCSFLVFFLAEQCDLPLMNFYMNPLGLAGVLATLLCLMLVLLSAIKERVYLAPFCAAASASLIVMTCLFVAFPFVIGAAANSRYRLSLLDGVAPAATQLQLLLALMIGLLFVLPMLGLLFMTFKRPAASVSSGKYPAEPARPRLS